MDIKCRKCRKVLISPEQCIDSVNAHNLPTPTTDPRNSNNSPCMSLSHPTSLFIDPEKVNAVEWIQREIEASEWSRSKLKCPSCSVVVGSFSYHSSTPCACGQSQLPNVQLIISKVDVNTIPLNN